jgi:hypothetical protein
MYVLSDQGKNNAWQTFCVSKQPISIIINICSTPWKNAMHVDYGHFILYSA